MRCSVCCRSVPSFTCRRCGTVVCAACYPSSASLGEDFTCKPCQVLPPGTAVCRLCRRRAGGAMLPVNDPALGYVHVRCAAMLPGCEVDVTLGMVRGVAMVPRRALELTCSVCGEVGGCVQCSWRKCTVAFHPVCLEGSCGSREDAPITELCVGAKGLVFLHCCPHHRSTVLESRAMLSAVLQEGEEEEEEEKGGGGKEQKRGEGGEDGLYDEEEGADEDEEEEGEEEGGDDDEKDEEEEEEDDEEGEEEEEEEEGEGSRKGAVESGLAAASSRPSKSRFRCAKKRRGPRRPPKPKLGVGMPDTWRGLPLLSAPEATRFDAWEDGCNALQPILDLSLEDYKATPARAYEQQSAFQKAIVAPFFRDIAPRDANTLAYFIEHGAGEEAASQLGSAALASAAALAPPGVAATLKELAGRLFSGTQEEDRVEVPLLPQWQLKKGEASRAYVAEAELARGGMQRHSSSSSLATPTASITALFSVEGVLARVEFDGEGEVCSWAPIGDTEAFQRVPFFSGRKRGAGSDLVGFRVGQPPHEQNVFSLEAYVAAAATLESSSSKPTQLPSSLLFSIPANLYDLASPHDETLPAILALQKQLQEERKRTSLRTLQLLGRMQLSHPHELSTASRKALTERQLVLDNALARVLAGEMPLPPRTRPAGAAAAAAATDAPREEQAHPPAFSLLPTPPSAFLDDQGLAVSWQGPVGATTAMPPPGDRGSFNDSSSSSSSSSGSGSGSSSSGGSGVPSLGEQLLRFNALGRHSLVESALLSTANDAGIWRGLAGHLEAGTLDRALNPVGPHLPPSPATAAAAAASAPAAPPLPLGRSRSSRFQSASWTIAVEGRNAVVGVPAGSSPSAPRGPAAAPAAPAAAAATAAASSPPSVSEDLEVCAVCFDYAPLDLWPLTTCRGCKMRVHRKCYGVATLEDEFLCDSCALSLAALQRPAAGGREDTTAAGSRAAPPSQRQQQGIEPAACLLCHQLGGPLKRTTSGGLVHLFPCALCTPGCWISDLESMGPIELSPAIAARWEGERVADHPSLRALLEYDGGALGGAAREAAAMGVAQRVAWGAECRAGHSGAWLKAFKAPVAELPRSLFSASQRRLLLAEGAPGQKLLGRQSCSSTGSGGFGYGAGCIDGAGLTTCSSSGGSAAGELCALCTLPSPRLLSCWGSVCAGGGKAATTPASSSQHDNSSSSSSNSSRGGEAAACAGTTPPPSQPCSVRVHGSCAWRAGWYMRCTIPGGGADAEAAQAAAAGGRGCRAGGGDPDSTFLYQGGGRGLHFRLLCPTCEPPGRSCEREAGARAHAWDFKRCGEGLAALVGNLNPLALGAPVSRRGTGRGRGLGGSAAAGAGSSAAEGGQEGGKKRGKRKGEEVEGEEEEGGGEGAAEDEEGAEEEDGEEGGEHGEQEGGGLHQGKMDYLRTGFRLRFRLPDYLPVSLRLSTRLVPGYRHLRCFATDSQSESEVPIRGGSFPNLSGAVPMGAPQGHTIRLKLHFSGSNEAAGGIGGGSGGVNSGSSSSSAILTAEHQGNAAQDPPRAGIRLKLRRD